MSVLNENVEINGWQSDAEYKKLLGVLRYTRYIIKIIIDSSCEIECFVETHLCKL